MKTHKARTFLRAVALLAVAVTGDNLAQAQTCTITWTGNADYWNNPDNWKPPQVPGPTDDVCIPSGEADGRTTPSISVNSIQVSGGAVLVFGTGTVSIATSLTVNQAYLSVLGTTPLRATSVDIPSSTLLGYGTIEASLTNDGFLEPNGGILTVTGDYTQMPGGQLSEQWGSTQILNVNGNASLSGNMIGKYDYKNPPKTGSTWTCMTYGSHSGAFTSTTGTAKYTNHSVVLKFD